MKETIRLRIKQLQSERAAVIARLDELKLELERGGHLLSAYDGAIGELTALVTSEEKED